MANIIRDEGVIKFNYQLKIGAKVERSDYLALEKWRTIFFRMNLIGEYTDLQLGYGNLSKRGEENTFIISGTQTGRHPQLKREQYCKVIESNLQKSKVIALGTIAPSSESLTHYAIYQANPQINYVFHVHHNKFWKKMLSTNYDRTPKDIRYGTIEMAQATAKIINLKSSGIFAMAGHEDGIISYGNSAAQAGKMILDAFKIISN
jgi:L-ribulose-5-phosphate 4-epimerase